MGLQTNTTITPKIVSYPLEPRSNQSTTVQEYFNDTSMTFSKSSIENIAFPRSIFSIFRNLTGEEVRKNYEARRKISIFRAKVY